MIRYRQVKEQFTYKDGILIRKSTGKPACPNSISRGYKTVKINGKDYKQHRIIFLYHYGYLPKVLDHKDRNKLNNTIKNLRPATKNGNNHNVGLSSHNTSGYKGVYWYKPSGRWRAMIKINRKQLTLGGFITIEAAAVAYNVAAKKYHGEFAYQNKILPKGGLND